MINPAAAAASLRIDTHPAFCYLHAHAERFVHDADLRRSKFFT